MFETYDPEARLNVGHEEISFSGHWEISHVDDPSFLVATRPEHQAASR